VDDAGTDDAFDAGEIPAVVKQGVDEGAGGAGGGRMDHQACGFVKHQNVRIFIKHCEGESLRFHGKRLGFRNEARYHVSAPDRMACLDAPSVEEDQTFLDQALGLGTGKARRDVGPRKELVEPFSLLGFGSTDRERSAFMSRIKFTQCRSTSLSKSPHNSGFM
jgi:hypothetical protein